jgi:hypothetical protein
MFPADVPITGSIRPLFVVIAGKLAAAGVIGGMRRIVLVGVVISIRLISTAVRVVHVGALIVL